MGRLRCHRRPRTTQERRASLEGWARGKRSFSNLPEAWDDIQREWRKRTWKEYRKHQWKPKNK